MEKPPPPQPGGCRDEGVSAFAVPLYFISIGGSHRYALIGTNMPDPGNGGSPVYQQLLVPFKAFSISYHIKSILEMIKFNHFY